MGGKKKWSKKLAVAVLATFVVVSSGAFEINTFAAQPNTKQSFLRGTLPIGQPGLPERRTVEHPAQGLTITSVYRGYADDKGFYTVNVTTVRDKDTAENITNLLEKAGFDPRLETLNERAMDDPAAGPYGYRVRVGFFKDKSSADAMVKRIKKANIYVNGTVIGGSVQYSGEDGSPTTGPWEIRILTVDPKQYRGEIQVANATPDSTGSETVSSMVQRTGALFGTNGSYFIMSDRNGSIGDVEGLSMINGRIISEVTNNTASFILPNQNGEGAKIEKLSMKISVHSSDGSTKIIDGINRKPGLILRCGGVNDTPTNKPKQSYLCKDADEIIYFTKDFGKNADAGTGVQVTLNKHGNVVSVTEERGGTIPVNGTILQGIGKGADWLRSHAKVGAKLKISHETKNSEGKSLKVNSHTSAVSAGPILVKNGKQFIDATAEGYNWSDNTLFYEFGVRRNPRTIAGTTPDGKIIIAVADGRNPGVAVGLSLKEEAVLMQSLGVTDAVNLDGGGSSTFIAPDGLRGNPSDGTERPVGDALLVLPPKRTSF